MARFVFISLLFLTALSAQDNRSTHTQESQDETLEVWLENRTSTTPTHKINRFVSEMDQTRRKIEGTFNGVLANAITLPENAKVSAVGSLNKVDVNLVYKF